MLGRIAGTVRFTEPLSFYTSLRIGGPAEFFVMPQDLTILNAAKFVLGLGPPPAERGRRP